MSTWLSAFLGPNQVPALGCRKTTLVRQRGFTLLELIVTLALLSLLVGAAIPVARNQIQRQRERELRRNLREIRMAIDRFRQTSGQFNTLETECFEPPPPRGNGSGYPKALKCLVDGIPDATGDKVFRFLRHLPRDPMTDSDDWGTASSSADVGGDEDIFDVYTKSTAKALNGRPYREW